MELAEYILFFIFLFFIFTLLGLIATVFMTRHLRVALVAKPKPVVFVVLLFFQDSQHFGLFSVGGITIVTAVALVFYMISILFRVLRLLYSLFCYRCCLYIFLIAKV
jgi:hypothetical protein